MQNRINQNSKYVLATTAVAIAAVFTVSACGQEPPASEEESLVRECGSTDERIGNTAALSTNAHKVSGTVTVIDDCHLRISAFNYDGGGLKVHAVGSATGDFSSGVLLSDDLLGTVYDNDTLDITLPEGITLDDVETISIWCVTAGVDFGSGTIM